MDVTQLLPLVSNLGLGGIVFVIWYFDNRKMDTMKAIVDQQVEEKKLMRDDRSQLVELVGKHAALIERTVVLLDRVEQRFDKVVG